MMPEEDQTTAFQTRGVSLQEKYLYLPTEETTKPNGVPSLLVPLLPYLKSFRTPEEHLLEVRKRGFYPQPSLFYEALSVLSRRGTFLSTRAITWKLKKKRARREKSAISALCWVTRDNPASLEGSMTSFLDNLRTYERELPVFLFDDSRSMTSRNEAILKKLKNRKGLKAVHIKEETRKKLCLRIYDALKQTGLRKSTLDFALFNPPDATETSGANRNAMLLFTTGRTILSVDDDIIAAPLILGDRAKIILDTSPAPGSTRFYSNLESFRNSIRPEPLDLLGAHEEILGRTPGELLITEERPLELKASSFLLKRLLETEAPIALTMPGMYGDTGMDSSKLFLWLEGEDRKSLFGGDYEEKKNSRLMRRIPGDLILNRGSALMCYNLGMDNRMLLPPFLSLGRAPEILFLRQLQNLYPTALTGHLPLGVLHRPEKGTRNTPEKLFDFRYRLGDLLVQFYKKNFTDPRGSLDEEWTRKYRYFSSIASLTDSDFYEFLVELQKGYYKNIMAYNNKLLLKYGEQPYWWAEDIYRMQGILMSLKKSSDLHLPRDMNWPDRNTATREIKKIIASWGELLQWWPRIRKAAENLREDLLKEV